ncbi:uncharacterized protein LOC113136961 [Mastacembelus armatus]|uniref:uncharacterized protein LOC113136961 n=1 Tax=Mastacembelus armatus TaxID=205130 RepID=UPI000E45C79B|nr:uncharacterized protein LOC113136961 [Mastacembelus armatus]
MAELTGIITSLFVMLLIDFPAETGQVSFIDIDVRDGDDVTLSCGHISKSKSDRLSVTENCSLVLKKVKVEDVGQYICRQFDTPGQKQGPDSVVYLSVVTMTEQKLHDKVTFSCQVIRHDHCHQSVKWLFQDKDVDQNNKDFQTSQTVCYATVTFLDSHFIYSSRFKLFKCEVTNPDSGKVQKFSFRRQSSGEETGENMMSCLRLKPPKSLIDLMDLKFEDDFSPSVTSDGNMRSFLPEQFLVLLILSGQDTTTTTTTATKQTAGDSPKASGWWRFIIVSVGLATLIIIVVTVNVWTRTKGKKTQMDKNTGRDDDDDEDEGRVKYENVGDPSVSVRLH